MGSDPSLPRRRVRRSPQQARAEIIAAAEHALAEGDFNALTVDRLMQRTGMTRSSFYHYFDDLDALVVGMLEQFERDIRDSVDPWLKGEEDTADYRGATHRHLTRMFEVMYEHRPGARAVAQTADGESRVYTAWQDRVIDYFVALTADFIERQVTLGRSRVTDPARLAQALILMNDAVANANLRRIDPDPPELAAGVLADVWNAAIYG